MAVTNGSEREIILSLRPQRTEEPDMGQVQVYSRGAFLCSHIRSMSPTCFSSSVAMLVIEYCKSKNESVPTVKNKET